MSAISAMLAALADNLEVVADTTRVHEVEICYRLAHDHLLQAIQLIRAGEDYESEGERCHQWIIPATIVLIRASRPLTSSRHGASDSV